jgi:hypothetical protein
MFFKEGQNEEFICHGAEVIEAFLQRGRLRSEVLPDSGKSPGLWQKHGDLLNRLVCLSCDFRREDCDFASDHPPADCEPCGGYVLLSLLLENRLISAKDFEE